MGDASAEINNQLSADRSSSDLIEEVAGLRREARRWEAAARTLARELGKDGYADAAYQDQVDSEAN